MLDLIRESGCQYWWILSMSKASCKICGYIPNYRGDFDKDEDSENSGQTNEESETEAKTLQAVSTALKAVNKSER